MLTHLQSYKSLPEPRVLGVCGGVVSMRLERWAAGRAWGLLRGRLVSLDFLSWGTLKEVKSKNGRNVEGGGKGGGNGIVPNNVPDSIYALHMS